MPISDTNCDITTVITGVFCPVRMRANRNSIYVNRQHNMASEMAGIADGKATR